MSIYNYPAAAARNFYTKVRNISTARKFFGFLPPHGRWLDPLEQIVFWGDITSWLNRMTPNQRSRRAFETAVAGATGIAASLAVIATPAVHLQDATTEDVMVIGWDSNVSASAPIMLDPSWGDYYSSTAV
jgi:hypothetical protein